MEEQTNDGFEVDIFQILGWLWDNVLLIVLVSAVFGLATFGYTYFRITPRYQASTTMYVNNNAFTIGSSSISVSATQLDASQSLVDTYVLVLRSRSTIERVIEKAGLPLSYSEVLSMITTKSISGTAAFTVSVSSTSAAQAEQIANTIADVLPDRISEVIFGTSVQIIDYAVVPAYSNYPNYTKSTLTGTLVGFVVSCLCIAGWNLLKEIRSGVVTSTNDLRKVFGDIPVFAVIPDIRYSNGNKGYGYYGYYDSDGVNKSEAKKA